MVERILPDAGNLSAKELHAISQSFCDTIDQFGKPHHWIRSFVTVDKIYCIHVAESEAVVREHAMIGKFRINAIAEVTAIMYPVTSNSLR